MSVEPELHYWIEPDGTEHDLNGIPVVALKGGNQGWAMPSFSFAADPIPFQAGKSLRSVRTDGHEIEVPLYIQAEDYGAALDTIGDMVRWFDPTRGDGRYRVERGQRSRELVCRYAGGFEDMGAAGRDALGWFVTPLRLVTYEEPYWIDADETSLTFTAADEVLFFPFPPLQLAATTVFAEPVIDNDGDVDTWPVWVIQGPGEDPTLTNETTGKSITVNGTLGAGDTVTIDTRPARKTVVDQNGSNLFASLGANPKLWPLVRGENEITVAMQNPESSSSLTLTYRRRYLSK